MGALKVVVTIALLIVCVALVVVVMMQEGKSAGLTGAISGAAETFWSKNKGRTKQGRLETLTKILIAAFMVLALVLYLLSKAS